MASEIEVRARLTGNKSGASVAIEGAGTFTWTGTKYQKGRQNVGTAEEALVLGDSAAGGWVMIKNLGPTNYLQVKAATGATPLIRINVDEFALFRLDSGASAPFVQANTGAVEIEYVVMVN